ncbi:hypothetical protein K9L27_00185 [Candidatus Gracilibacteria bacterium]|nr:hypothetical protein [Candidatus Gracilibacteria bacterium]
MRIFLSILFLSFGGSTLAATLPEANLTITPSTIEEGKEVTFDASDSRNTNGQKGGLEYRFQFNPSQNWTPWSTQSLQKFKPLDMGTFQAKLQVRDKQWKTVQTTYRKYRVVGDIYRKIRIKVSPTRIRAGEPIYFELVFTLPRTDDPDKLFVRWDFNSDGFFEIPWSAYRIVSHVFGDMEVGSFSPTAEVKFPDGSIQQVRGIERISVAATRQPIFKNSWNKINVLPPSVVAPIVNVSPGKQGFNEDTTFRFDASSSRVAEHAWIEWSFDGEEFVQDKTIVYKKFDSPGRHEVRTRTCYDHANPQCRETLTTIDVRTDPIDFRAEISVQNLTRNTTFYAGNTSGYFAVVVGDRLQFSANLRRQDVVEKEFSYRWDFDGDKDWDTIFLTSPVAEYVFPRPGIYYPTIDVENEKGLDSMVSMPLTVYANTVPQASFTVDRREIYPGDLVRFYPKVSDLQNRSGDLEVRFDADGDGNWDQQFRRSTTHQWRYDTPGTYIASMQVRDANKSVTTISRSITVLPYQTPKARVTISQREGDTRTAFRFDASRSSGQNLKYFWDFDYKGPQDIVNQGQLVYYSTPKVQKKFSTSGEKQILLRVVDGGGNKDELHFPIFISQYTVPQKVPAVTPLSPVANPSSAPTVPAPTFVSSKTITAPTLSRADVFFLLYETLGTPPPFPTENPFVDVRETDWFYDVALQAKQDGLIWGDSFYPQQIISAVEVQELSQAILKKSIDISDPVTREGLQRALQK